jgi:hypothetical protein
MYRKNKNHFPPNDPGNPTVNFHGEKRCNQTHESKTDPNARLARKSAGKEAKLSSCGNLLAEPASRLRERSEFAGGGPLARLAGQAAGPQPIHQDLMHI